MYFPAFVRSLHRESRRNPQHVVQHFHSREEAVLHDSVCGLLLGQRQSAHLDNSAKTGSPEPHPTSDSFSEGRFAPLSVHHSGIKLCFLLQGLKAGSLHFPGTAATYKEETVKVRVVEPRFYDYSNETEWRLNIDKVIGEWFHQQDLDFVSLYFGEPDKVGHKYGPDSPERRAMVRQVDRTVGYIRDKINTHGLTDKLNIIITADHGMTTVLRGEGVQEILLSKIPGFSFRDIKFHLVDYGPTGMLLPKEGKLETVYQALKGGHPRLHVYKKEEMPARLHYGHHPRLLPIILIADAGFVINGVRD